ncbi:aromatic-amino-acid aminotransferase [Aureobasidium pullulans]|nr:aromatic-amino-acid aminotransferase [Aureobasidium pullulans]
MSPHHVDPANGTTEEVASVFANAPLIPADEMFALAADFKLDQHPNKVNLGPGSYKDENGQPWILPSVAVSRRIIAEQGLYHEYLPILGLPEFRTGVAKLVLGDAGYQLKESKIASGQTISGTGALHMAGLFLKRFSSLSNDVYISDPTWMNHHGVFKSLGFNCLEYRYYDAETKTLAYESIIQTLESATSGSIVVLHACAHNPTGCDLSREQWRKIAGLIKARGLFPLFDAAYLGFNSGNIEDDAFAIRHFINDLGMEAIVSVSFAKNMGERVGCLLLVSSTEEAAKNSQSALESLTRIEFSNSPAYGARIAATILQDKELVAQWHKDLVTMSSRITDMRDALYQSLSKQTEQDWTHIIRQSGMFGFLGLSPVVVRRLRDEYHIYMAESSRISIAGLNPGNVEYVASCIVRCLQ